MAWEAEDKTWQTICAGRLCVLCQAVLPAPQESGFAYCASCLPAGAERPRLVYISIDHALEGWSVCFSSVDEPRFTYWMEAVDDAQLDRLVERARMSPHERSGHSRALRAWGRHGFYAHLSHAQHRNLHRTWQSDPRNGYEKRHGLPAGATARRRL